MRMLQVIRSGSVSWQCQGYLFERGWCLEIESDSQEEEGYSYGDRKSNIYRGRIRKKRINYIKIDKYLLVQEGFRVVSL